MTAQDIIEQLLLEPHPEGGYYRETFRDPLPVGARSHCTAIFFLLTRGELSRFHRVDSAEIFHFYLGAPLELITLEKDASGREREVTRLLGPDLSQGQLPQLVVSGGTWQAARSLGDYTLVGCTVSPGFLFSNFELKE